MFTRRVFGLGGLSAAALLGASPKGFAADGAAGAMVAAQPYFSSVARILDAMRRLGEPLPVADERRLRDLAEEHGSTAVSQAEAILDRFTLLRATLAHDGTRQLSPGRAPLKLVEQGWRSFLLRIENPAAHQVPINLISDAAILEGILSNATPGGIDPRAFHKGVGDFKSHWLGISSYVAPPLSQLLSGIEIEYRIVQLYSRDRGRRRAHFVVIPSADPTFVSVGWIQLGQKTPETSFECLPSRDIKLDIRDWDGAGCVASLIVKDSAGRLYPAPAHRLAPDLTFQPQVYRAHGETLRLPDGRYSVESWRGPEYERRTQELVVGDANVGGVTAIELRRWINAAALGWYPGDTHIHAAGCSHYSVPSQGVGPETMLRHVRGEGLSVGDVLTWAPGFGYQRQFFSGHVYHPQNSLELSEYQAANNTSLTPQTATHDSDSIIRYDLEISGFPSSTSGHLVLLRLNSIEFPGAKSIGEWPSWNLPVLKWAREQGAVVGYAHCGAGLFVNSTELPNYEIPLFDSVGANEFVVDVTHGAVDFVSGAEVEPTAELNFWYHALNCGFRIPMLGETDFPCISDERVGTGRTYVGLDHAPSGDEGYSNWLDAIKKGRLYFGDGRSHLIDFRVDGLDVGHGDVNLKSPGRVTVTATVAARLEERAPDTFGLPLWHIERARLGTSRTVPVGIIVNGREVARKSIVADGRLHGFSLDINIDRSSWIALRILPSSHTAPIFITVAGKPVRASRKSARWCLDCVDAVWAEKSPYIADRDLDNAKLAYEFARSTYREILSQCDSD